MNQGEENGKPELEVKIKENSKQLHSNYDSRKKTFILVRGHRKKEVSGMKPTPEKISSDRGATFVQCFPGSTFPPQYEEECPVNYSLKYSETESCKAVNKTEPSKKKFKDYTDYSETDLDQPTNFSLKYSENNCCDEETKNPILIYYPEDKRKFKQYADYAETDLDQPTDFTLKYRETVDEDGKNSGFNFYENHKGESSDCYGSLGDPEEPPSDPAAEPFPVPDETPLMFSRCSSLNSLSSFVHITQSTPDDRSSVVSDFSRMTSGIISPSELPDSPTQTAPSSPKKVKPPVCFSTKVDFLPKKSVFEDDVATYKQEDTPVEFSRATSLSSLNLENSVKSEGVFKANFPGVVTCTKEAKEDSCSDFSKGHVLTVKTDPCKEKFELTSVREVDENSKVSRIGTFIQSISPKTCSISNLPPRKKLGSVPAPSNKLPRNQEFALKHSIRHKLASETEKVYSAFDVSDDIVHTYYTEGTPANISHAGSQSDLTALAVAPAGGAPAAGLPDRFCSEPPSDVCPVKAKSELFNEEISLEVAVNKMLPPAVKKMSAVPKRNACLNSQPRFECLRRDAHLTVKDDVSSFADESNPCDFSTRSPFADLTVNVIDSPLCLNRSEPCEEPTSQILSSLHNVSPQSPNSINLAETEDEKHPELPKTFNGKGNYWMGKNLRSAAGRCGADESAFDKFKWAPTNASRFDFYSSEPLTPFEEALLEQCIRLGMPPTKGARSAEDRKDVKSSADEGKADESELGFGAPGAPSVQDRTDGKTTLGSSADNFDFDSSAPLTLFEEALLEQCIRLGMSRKDESTAEGGKEADSRQTYSDHVTPLEAALLEQCIRLGMPRKKTSKKPEENSLQSEALGESEKLISSVSAQLNKIKINGGDGEKIKDGLSKGEHFDCRCGKRHNRRKNAGGKKSKKCKS